MRTKHFAFSAMAGLLLASAASSQVVTTMADFEEGREFNNIVGSWYYSDDGGAGGDSKITSGDTSFKPSVWNSNSFIAPGYNNSKYAAKFSFVLGTKMNSCGTTPNCYPPEVTMGTDLKNGGDTVLDMTGATKLTFWAKADAPMQVLVMITLASVTDFGHYRDDGTIKLTTEWKEFSINLRASATFHQPSWAKPTPFNPALIQAMNWTVTKNLAPNANLSAGTFYLDDIKIHGWAPAPIAVMPGKSNGERLRALKPGADGQSLRFGVPAAYREVAGTIAATDLSGKVIAEAAFAKGQEHVTLKVGRTGAPVFFRVHTR